MSLLANVKTDDSIEQGTDQLGGGGPVESGLYKHKVTMAYLTKSAGGAVALNVSLADETGRELREQFWILSGDAKGNKHYYEKDGKKHFLPGFEVANTLAQLTVGKELNLLTEEEKVLNLWNSTAQAEVPTTVPVLVELLGQDIFTGVFKQTVNKSVKQDDGSYLDTAETREVNEISKFFCARDSHLKMTLAEILAGAEKADFCDKWEAKWTGVTRNRAKDVAGGKPGAPGGTAAKPASLFAQ